MTTNEPSKAECMAEIAACIVEYAERDPNEWSIWFARKALSAAERMAGESQGGAQ